MHKTTPKLQQFLEIRKSGIEKHAKNTHILTIFIYLFRCLALVCFVNLHPKDESSDVLNLNFTIANSTLQMKVFDGVGGKDYQNMR